MSTAVLAYSGGLDTSCTTLHGGTPGSPVRPLFARVRATTRWTEPAADSVRQAPPGRSAPPAGQSPAPAAARSAWRAAGDPE